MAAPLAVRTRSRSWLRKSGSGIATVTSPLTGTRMVWIPGGSEFTMGNANPAAPANEQPAHRVHISTASGCRRDGESPTPSSKILLAATGSVTLAEKGRRLGGDENAGSRTARPSLQMRCLCQGPWCFHAPTKKCPSTISRPGGVGRRAPTGGARKDRAATSKARRITPSYTRPGTTPRRGCAPAGPTTGYRRSAWEFAAAAPRWFWG